MNGLDAMENPPFDIAFDKALHAMVSRFFSLGIGKEGEFKRNMKVIACWRGSAVADTRFSNPRTAAAAPIDDRPCSAPHRWDLRRWRWRRRRRRPWRCRWQLRLSTMSCSSGRCERSTCDLRRRFPCWATLWTSPTTRATCTTGSFDWPRISTAGRSC
ncbi:TPA: hypothetical protein N0F65_011826 [Lagenidium giganteum]|uniref:Uncharacterized protein n=1 Tax=Lagenidium giganteum TaxID=4803 RepID=A0AAV2Z1G9_9STRA|nr:TPA: hypothetical protein N0F65_011826 [Lagenidium giganteum]